VITKRDNYDFDRKLAKLDVPEGHYKADLELHDRSQSFSSELLKLALAGIAVVGFLLANIPNGPLEHSLKDTAVRVLFSAAVVAFALAVGAALLQRFYASGAMFHHLQVIKLLMLPESVSEHEVKENLSIRTEKFMRAHAFLKCAAWLLVTAALFLSIAFIRMMFRA
jgi:hypothetical protein